MPGSITALSRLAAALFLGLALSAHAADQEFVRRLSDTIQRLETRLHARVGVVIEDVSAGWSWRHRADERFPMNSTVKTVVCAAVLARVDKGSLTLDELLPIRKGDVLSYAPVTQGHVGQSMSIGGLCLAALDLSDNTAVNLLEARLGGPEAVTALLRGIGDTITRADRPEPYLNDFAPDDPRDTTTPAAMANTLKTMLLGGALTQVSRKQLAAWMSHGSVTGGLLRAAAPTNWTISDKSGAGDQARNIIAVLTPPGHDPWIVTLYISGATGDFATRDAAMKELAAGVLDVLKAD